MKTTLRPVTNEFLKTLREMQKKSQERYELNKNYIDGWQNIKTLQDNIKLINSKKYPKAKVEIAIQLEPATFSKVFIAPAKVTLPFLKDLLKYYQDEMLKFKFSGELQKRIKAVKRKKNAV